jgi:SWI/SNF related-matrix-associated actin-dependent regulator of chromatin subfamily C
MHSGGFVRMDEEAFKHALGTTAAEWTDQETLLLLEGIEMYDEDWDKVAQHVGTRSKEQCVMHFLQLPIEDEYLNEPDAQLGPLQYSINAGGVSGLEGLPFAQADNPVMSVVAFLASAVGPGVAAAAAQSALGELTNGLRRAAKEKPEKVEEKTDDKADDKPEEDEADKAGKSEEMEVDQPETETVTEDADKPKTEATEAPEAAAEDVPPTLPRSQVERAAALALGAAAAKASTLAVHEERHIQTLMTRLIQAQTRKLESKITMFEKFEELLEQEKRSVEVAKQQFFKERLTLVGQLRQVQTMLKQAREMNVGVNEQIVKRAEEMENALAATTAGATVEVTPGQGEATKIELPDSSTATYATLS